MSTPTIHAGLSRDEIKGKLITQYGTMTAVAELIDEKPKPLSDTLTRHVRNERIRLKLCNLMGKSYRSLWGEKPNGKSKDENSE